MAKPLNFNNIKKQYLTVTLADKKNTVLMIGTPTKSVMEDLQALQDSIEGVEGETLSNEATDELYEACAKVMSRNKAGIVITKEFLSDLFDFEDIYIFFNAYMDFIKEVAEGKN